MNSLPRNVSAVRLFVAAALFALAMAVPVSGRTYPVVPHATEREIIEPSAPPPGTAPLLVASSSATPVPTVAPSVILPVNQRASTTLSPGAVQDQLRWAHILTGDPSGFTTPPNAPIARATFLVLLGRALCIKPVVGAVPAGQPWYGASFQALSEYVPMPSSQRLANLPPSREEAARETMQLVTASHIVDAGAIPTRLPKFADEDLIAPNARAAAKTAVYLHLMSIGKDNHFNPKGTFYALDAYQAAYQVYEQRATPCG